MSSETMQEQQKLQFEAIIGAYLLVAFADGRFDKSEEIGVRLSLLRDSKPNCISDVKAEETYGRLRAHFARNPDKAAQGVLAQLENLRGDGLARTAVVKVVRKALMADGVVTPQEESAMDKVAAALGLRQGEL